MFVLLLAPENFDEELVAILIHTKAKGLGVLQELRKDGVGVAQRSRVNVIILQIALHQRVQFSEQLQFQQELDVGLVPCKVQVERRNQGHYQSLLV